MVRIQDDDSGLDCLAFQFSSICITYFHPPLNSPSRHHSTSGQILIALSLPESLSLSVKTGEKNLSKIPSYKEVWLWSLSRKARVLYSHQFQKWVWQALSGHFKPFPAPPYLWRLLAPYTEPIAFVLNTSLWTLTLHSEHFPFPPWKSLQSLSSPNVTSLQQSRIQFEQHDRAIRTQVNWGWVQGREAAADEWQVYINKITCWKPQDNYCFYAEILAGQLW